MHHQAPVVLYRMCMVAIRDEHNMLLKFPIILSSNIFLYLLFSKLFSEVMPNIGNLTCIAISTAILDTIAILY